MKTSPVTKAWNRIEQRLGRDAKALAKPLTKQTFGETTNDYAEVLDHVLDQVFLPAELWASYARHDGETRAVVCPPAKLVSADVAFEFALVIVGQQRATPPVDKAWAAAMKLVKRHSAAMAKQRLDFSGPDEAWWTLALGKPGHRIALDCAGGGGVVEFFADGTVAKRADGFLEWLESLG